MEPVVQKSKKLHSSRLHFFPCYIKKKTGKQLQLLSLVHTKTIFIPSWLSQDGTEALIKIKTRRFKL